MVKISIKNTTLELIQGDITEQNTEAIVNAANAGLTGGGGVDGAIHHVGGPQIMEECQKIGGCPTGEAIITSGGNLQAQYVIHTVGPVWHGGNLNEAYLLKNSYQNSLKLADEHNITTISFPSISTGAYGYPVSLAAPVALDAIREYLESETNIREVNMVLFSKEIFKIFEDTLYKKR